MYVAPVGARTERIVAVKLGEIRTSVMTTEDECLSLYYEFSSKHDGKPHLTSGLRSWTMSRGGDGVPETYLPL